MFGQESRTILPVVRRSVTKKLKNEKSQKKNEKGQKKITYKYHNHLVKEKGQCSSTHIFLLYIIQ
jgi:hypothetical protein